jgi:hypothetical protein
MEKIENFKEKINDIIYPVFYDKGILFKDITNNSFFLFKENLIRKLTLDEIIGDIFYPSTNEELIEIESVINYIFTRLSNSQFINYNDKELFKIIKKIKINSVMNLANLNNISQATQLMSYTEVFEEINSKI